ncbi:MAG TPA: hypothetical protein VFE57_03155 [Cyclobacteriaceae bacterium]|jgi:hypothetical protein|nr:hypothetical protein [Cyclobacteriaceae bacterium]
MVEVFKTNVHDEQHARLIIEEIHRSFMNYKATFDLEDCDRILRIQCDYGLVEAPLLVTLIDNLGYKAEVLEDEIPIPSNF